MNLNDGYTADQGLLREAARRKAGPFGSMEDHIDEDEYAAAGRPPVFAGGGGGGEGPSPWRFPMSFRFGAELGTMMGDQPRIMPSYIRNPAPTARKRRPIYADVPEVI